MRLTSIENYIQHLNKWDIYPVVSTIYSGPARILAAAVQIVAGTAFAAVSAAFDWLNNTNSSPSDRETNFKEISYGMSNLLRGIVALCPFAGNLAIYLYEKSAPHVVFNKDVDNFGLLSDFCDLEDCTPVAASKLCPDLSPELSQDFEIPEPKVDDFPELGVPHFKNPPLPKVILKRDANGYYTLPHINVPGFVNMGTFRSREINIRSGNFIIDTANGILPEGWVFG